MTVRSSRRRAGTPATNRQVALAACRRLRALREWLRGYLHEDYAAEYGGAAGAAVAFCRDASPAERRRLRADWHAFRALTEGWPVDDVAVILTTGLGGSWIPSSARELAAVGHALDASCPE
jgi:hypothetical protein